MMWHGIGADEQPETIAEKCLYYAEISAVTIVAFVAFVACVVASGIL